MLAQSLANIPVTIRLWRLRQIHLKIDESGGLTIRRCVVVLFAHMHLPDIAGDVGSFCEVRPGPPIVGSQRCGHGLFDIEYVGYDDVGTGM